MTGMNRPIKRVALAVLVMFVILLVNVNYLQAVQAPSLANRPLNDRTEYEQNQVQRGNIVTADGVTIATTKPSNDLFKYQRVYPDGPSYAPVTGYDTIFTQSQAPNYATGVERAENALLTGTGSQLAFRNFIDMITNKPQKGATVQVTINSKAQQVAYQQLQAGARRARRSTASSRSAAWSRSTRPPARSWPWRPTRASTRTSSRCTTPPSSTRSTASSARRTRARC